MPPGCGFDFLVDRVRDYGAEGLGGRSVAKAPEVFDFFLWEVEDFGDVKVRGEGFYGGMSSRLGGVPRWRSRDCICCLRY